MKRSFVLGLLALVSFTTLILGQAQTNSVSPSSFSFLTVAGDPDPAAQTLTINLLQSTPNWVLSHVLTNDGNPWLNLSASSGTGSGTVNVLVTAANLQPGRYTGTFTIHVQNTQDDFTQSVTFDVAPSRLMFKGAQGAANPAGQTLQISVASGGSLNVGWSTSVSTSSGGGWLSVTPANGSLAPGASGMVTINASTAGLSQGTYNGQVNFSGVTAPNPPVAPVVLVVGPAQPSTNPTNLLFSGTAGGSDPAAQTLALTVPAGFSPTTWTSAATTNAGGNWLTVSPASGAGSGQLTVSATGLSKFTSGGVFTGSVTLTFGSTVVTIPVQLTAGLGFSGNPGGSNPAAQTIAVTTANTWTAAAATTTGGQWLSISPATGAGNGTITATATITGLALGTYTGMVTVTIGTGANATTQVTPVTLVIAAPSLSVSPGTLTFNTTFATNPQPQTVSVTAASAWTASVTTQSGGNWLSVSPASGATSGPMTVTVTPGSLAGQFKGQIAVSLATGQPFLVSVTMNVTGPGLSVSPILLSFAADAGTNPKPQQLQINSSSTTPGTSWQATATAVTPMGGPGANWLSVTPGGPLPSSATVSVQSEALAPSNGVPYAGTIVITDPNATPSSVTVGVLLTVNVPQQGTLAVSPSTINLTGVVGQPVGGPPISISTNVASLNWSAIFSTDTVQGWLALNATSGTTSLGSPSQPQLIINTSPLTKAGVYTGSVTISSTAAGVAPQSVRIQLTMVQGPTMYLSQTGVRINGTSDAPPVSVLNIGSGQLSWTASVVAGPAGLVGSWPAFRDASGNRVTSLNGVSVNGTPSQLTLAGLASAQATDSYGIVAVTPSVGPTQYIQLVAPGTVSPTPFPAAVLLRASRPNATVTISGLNVAVPYTASASANWAAPSVTSGTLQPGATLTIGLITANAPTTPGVYTTTVVYSLSLPGTTTATTLTVAVYLIVPSTSQAEPQSVTAPAAGCTPASLVMVVRSMTNSFNSTVGWPVNLEAQLADNCANDVVNGTVLASFSNGDAPLSLVSLGAGIYSATWKPSNANPAQVTARGFAAGFPPVSVSVAGNVAANPAPPPAVSAGGVVNGASFSKNGGLAPGGIVSIFGTNLATGTNGASFPLPTSLGGIKMSVGGKDMPLFFANGGQVNAQVPAELQTASTTQVVARFSSGGNELIAVPETITLADAQPGIFVTGSASQGVILNNPALQVVDATHQATANDVLTIYCTGLGLTTPVVATGQPSPSSPPATVTGTTVTIGGVNAPVQFSGLTPGFVGLYQVNVTVPSGVTPGGAVQVVLSQNGVPSNTVTIGIK